MIPTSPPAGVGDCRLYHVGLHHGPSFRASERLSGVSLDLGWRPEDYILTLSIEGFGTKKEEPIHPLRIQVVENRVLYPDSVRLNLSD